MIQASTYSQGFVASDRSSDRGVGIGLAVGLSVVAVAALWVGDQAQLLRIALPACAAFVGLVLYFNRPVLFVQYTLWIWFLTPLARRLVDWRFGFTEPNFVLLAPFLVSGIAGLTLLRSTDKAAVRIPAPFVLCVIAIFYGFSVGVVLRPSMETVFGLLDWLCPLLFGLHLYSTWHLYDQYCVAIGKCFLWAVILLGLYGIYQFFFPPIWDRYWLENVMATNASFGLPEPLMIRVWSTMNSPAPFANFMAVGLLLLVTLRSPLKLPAAVAGYVSFLLSVVRTAWLSWAVGSLVMLKSAKPRQLIAVLFSLILLLGSLFLVIYDPRLSNVVGDRLRTFTDLSHDGSFAARVDMYRILAVDALNNPFGRGLTNLQVSRGMAIDSGILALVFSLGWLGTALYACGIFLVFVGRGHANPGDTFAVAGKAILIAILAQLIAGDVFANLTGAMFWIFAGMYLAGFRYHESQVAAAEQLPAA